MWFHRVRDHDLAVAVAFGHQLAGVIGNTPFQMAIPGHDLGPLALPVKEQFDPLRFAEGNHPDILSLLARPVPAIGQQMHQGLVRPARLEIVVFVFRESAHVQQPGIIADVRPAVGVGFALCPASRQPV